MPDDNKNFGEGSDGSFDKGNKKSSDFGDKAKEEFNKAKDSGKEFGDKAKEEFDKAKESGKEFADDAKKAANEFGEGAKKTANEFSEGAKEAFAKGGAENKKILAGILAIVLGGFGIHKFVLGYTKEGIIMLVATIILGAITCGFAAWAVWVIGLIEGIIYLTKTDAEFYNTYQVGNKPWF